ncbi:MAG: hypothetical protein JO006_04010 [Paucibacter sp.]|nr:hypothetical protein [Roseateles sp.]
MALHPTGPALALNGLSRRRTLASALIALFPGTALAIEARLPFASGGTLVMDVPDGWRQGSQRAKTPTMVFKPPVGEAFMVLVSTFLPRTGPTTPAAVRKLMEATLAQARPNAEDADRITLKEISGASVHGLYFSATDKAPKASEYKYLTQGVFLAGGRPAAFTILTNDDSRYAAGLALLMFSTAHRA